jgi:hypothetical protein
MKKELEGKFTVVTVVSQFKQRYVIPTEGLQELNQDFDLDAETAKVWAEESVMAEEVKEFSQNWLGETVIDIDVVDEDRVIELMARDNKYLVEGDDPWPREKQIKFVNNWKEERSK